MKKYILAAAMACGAIGMLGSASTVSAQANGNAYGYSAGRICDAVFSWTDPTTTNPYWVNQGIYKTRGACVAAHVKWLKEGNPVPPWA